LHDLERLADFFVEHNPLLALETLELIEEAVSILQRHPFIGRPVESVEPGLRELVISRGHTGYLALYSFEVQQNTVLILAIRHQREAGYASDESAQ
jgi:plasmid stabilization system protein ParE